MEEREAGATAPHTVIRCLCGKGDDGSHTATPIHGMTIIECPSFPRIPLAVLYINRTLTNADVEYLDMMLAMKGCEWRKGEGRTARVVVIEEATSPPQGVPHSTSP